jgi:hypothetical protein
MIRRNKREETGQQEIIGETKSDILRYNGNKEPAFVCFVKSVGIYY